MPSIQCQLSMPPLLSASPSTWAWGGALVLCLARVCLPVTGWGLETRLKVGGHCTDGLHGRLSYVCARNSQLLHHWGWGSLLSLAEPSTSNRHSLKHVFLGNASQIVKHQFLSFFACLHPFFSPGSHTTLGTPLRLTITWPPIHGRGRKWVWHTHTHTHTHTCTHTHTHTLLHTYCLDSAILQHTTQWINTTQSYQCAGVTCAILRSCNYSTHAISGFWKVQRTLKIAQILKLRET